jgi:hypothetical protein
MTLSFRPVDCFVLGFERGEHMVCMIFDHKIGDRASLRTALGTWFNKNVGPAPSFKAWPHRGEFIFPGTCPASPCPTPGA